ncbi:hypothetical protein Tco_0527115 [Tanacetum coccineum]
MVLALCSLLLVYSAKSDGSLHNSLCSYYVVCSSIGQKLSSGHQFASFSGSQGSFGFTSLPNPIVELCFPPEVKWLGPSNVKEA